MVVVAASGDARRGQGVVDARPGAAARQALNQIRQRIRAHERLAAGSELTIKLDANREEYQVLIDQYKKLISQRGHQYLIH